MDIKQKITENIEQAVKKLNGPKIQIQLEHPNEPGHGDYATNVALKLASFLKKSPLVIANEIKKNLKKDEDIETVKVEPPGFINFFLSKDYLGKEVERVISDADKYGSQNIGKGDVVVIDYSAPNIAKPMGAGHLRSTIIGQSIYNIYSFLGYKCIGDNHIGDWGTQFGKLIVAYKKWGNPQDIEKTPIKELYNLYVRFTNEAKNDSSLEDQARLEFKKLEDGNPENYGLWKKFLDWSMADFNKVYDLLNVRIDYTLGESFYEKMLSRIIEDVKKKKVVKVDPDGSVLADLTPYNLGKCLIQKSDGATLYHTRDLATFKYRLEHFHPKKILYVIGADQKLYLQQLFKMIELWGYKDQIELVHIDFGLVHLEGRKMATREGRTVFLEDVLNKAIALSLEVVQEKSKNIPEKDLEKIAKTVGVGAVKYNDLSQNRTTTIDFDWKKMLSIEGNSAPYLQYTYARANSVLEKAQVEKKCNADLLKTDEEKNLLRSLYRFPEVVVESAQNYAPNLIGNFLYELASEFNVFYNCVPILKAEEQVKQARLSLTLATAQILKNGLALLGIDAPKKM